MKVHYELLSKYYHQNDALGNKIYKQRIENPNTCILNLDSASMPFFFCVTTQISCLVEKIWKLNARLQQLTSRIPAREILLRNALFEEIKCSNDIEGIHSSRKMLKEASQKKTGRFYGQVCQYEKILDEITPAFPLACQDIRNYYDELLYDEIQREDPEALPDGNLFRIHPVYIHDGTKMRYTGIMPEEKIETMLQNCLDWMQSQEVPALACAAVFHFVFSYIHPFYDGNDRLNRFLTTVFLANELGSAASLLLSQSLRKHRSEYYKAFEILKIYGIKMN